MGNKHKLLSEKDIDIILNISKDKSEFKKMLDRVQLIDKNKIHLDGTLPTFDEVFLKNPDVLKELLVVRRVFEQYSRFTVQNITDQDCTLDPVNLMIAIQTLVVNGLLLSFYAEFKNGKVTSKLWKEMKDVVLPEDADKDWRVIPLYYRHDFPPDNTMLMNGA